MRRATPYAVDGGPPITRHRLLPGRHRGWHEATPAARRATWATPPSRSRKLGSIATMVIAIAAVPASWALLLSGVGLPRSSAPIERAPAVPPTVAILPPISVGPPVTARPTVVDPTVAPTVRRHITVTASPTPTPMIRRSDPALVIPTRSVRPSCQSEPTESRKS